MTDEEIEQLLNSLEQLLIEVGLAFVVTQERVLAAEGVSQSPVDTLRAGPDGGAHRFGPEAAPFGDVRGASAMEAQYLPTTRQLGRTPRFKRSDVVVTPLDPRTRLGILFDLIEVATAATLAMEHDVRRQFEQLRRVSAHRQDSVHDLAAPGQARFWGEAWNGAIVFTDPPEAELRDQRRPTWTLESVEARQGSVLRTRALIETLDALRAETSVARGPWLNAYGDGDEENWNLDRSWA